MNIPLNLNLKPTAQGLRRALAAAAIALAASCGADSLPSLPQQASSTAPSAASTAPQGSSPTTTMPKDLRASYVAAVQKGASEAYAATSLAPGRLQLVNPAQRFVTSLNPAGVRIASEQQPWALSMRASGLGCDGAVAALDDALPEAEGNRIRYHHPGMEGWYLNGPLGLEQGFILPQAPACAGAKVVTLELGGDLHPKLEDPDGDGRGEALTLLDGEGHTALQYRDLFVKDAQGKELSAWMTVEAGRLSLHVDDAGAAYPVEIDPLVWAQQAKLLASDGALDDRFGFSVALSGDTALVGAHGDDDNGAWSGSAYVFVKIAGVWTQQAKLLPTDGVAGDEFGYSVALSGDTALVGAIDGVSNGGSHGGAAYVFVRSGGTWIQEAKLLASDGGFSRAFGYSVALSGDTALVGDYQDISIGYHSGSAYVFVRSAGAWTQQAKLLQTDAEEYDEFGCSVALSGDMALVGAHNDDDNGFLSGSAYVFMRSAGAWTQQAKLLPTDGTPYDGFYGFGSSVALSGDTALVGALARDNHSNYLGSAYVFVRSAGAWTQQAKLLPTDPGAKKNVYTSVALLGDTALVGTHLGEYDITNGSAYVFVRSAGAWIQQAKLLPPDGGPYDGFGYAVALSGDTALVGAYKQADYTGAAYVFQVLRNNGAPCAIGGECASTFCVDGVCCDTACGGGSATDCQACSVAAGTKMDGTCAPRVQGTSCRPSAGGCDAPEVCDGVADSCPADAKVAAGTACRASIGACDVAELCDGLASDCPADAKVAAGTACRASTGACDVAELCDGLASDCPADAKVAAGTACRAATGACDVAELCDGLASDCPTDAKVAAGTACRAATGACDVAELCDGLASDCPTDAKVAAGTLCRAATGSCDVAESCDGKDAQCPVDGSAPDGMMCTGGVCASGKCVEESSSTSGSSSGESGSAGGASTSSSGGSGGEPQDTGGCACRAAGGSSGDSRHGAGSLLGLFGLGLMVLRHRHRARA